MTEEGSVPPDSTDEVNGANAVLSDLVVPMVPEGEHMGNVPAPALNVRQQYSWAGDEGLAFRSL